MIVRILLVVFISVTSGAGYLAGFVRLISGLLVGFGALVSMFFAILFIAVIYLIIMVILQLDRDDKDFLSSIDFLKNMVLKARK